MDPGFLDILTRGGIRLWRALDGPQAPKVSRLAIFGIIIVLGIGGWIALGRFSDIDESLKNVQTKVGGIPAMAEARNLELADMKRRDDREDEAIKEHDRLIAATAHDLHALAEVTADLRGQVTVLIHTVFADRGPASQAPSSAPETFRREKR